MPSVSASCGNSSPPRPWGRQGAGGASRGSSDGWCSARCSSIPIVSDLVSVHTPYTSQPPGATSSTAASTSSRLQRGEPRLVVGRDAPAGVGAATQHAEAGAGRVDEHPRRTNGRHRAAVVRRRQAAGCDHRSRRCRPRRCSRPSSVRGPRGRPSASTVAPLAAIAVALPPGAAHTSAIRMPRAASTSPAIHSRRLVLDVAVGCASGHGARDPCVRERRGRPSRRDPPRGARRSSRDSSISSRRRGIQRAPSATRRKTALTNGRVCSGATATVAPTAAWGGVPRNAS